MPNSPRMTWIYPGQDEDPWFDRFSAMILAMDASGFAAREDRHMILARGGTIAWDSGTGLTWSDEIWLTAPITGFTWRLAANVSPLAIADGQVLYAILNRGPLANTALTPLVGSTVPSTDDAVVFAIRIGTTLYWRSGNGLATGASISGLGLGNAGTTRILQAFNEEVTDAAPTFFNVGSLYLKAGTLKAPARVFTGATTAGPDGADVELRRETGGTVIATWTVTGTLAEAVQGADVVIPADDWYHIRLRGNGAGVVAILKGIDWILLQ